MTILIQIFTPNSINKLNTLWNKGRKPHFITKWLNYSKRSKEILVFVLWKRGNEIAEHFVHPQASSVPETEDGNLYRGCLVPLPLGAPCTFEIQARILMLIFQLPWFMCILLFIALGSRETRTSARKVLITEAWGTAVLYNKKCDGFHDNPSVHDKGVILVGGSH